MKVVELIGQIDRYGEDEDHRQEDMLTIGNKALCDLEFNYDDEIYITYYISDVELTKKEFVENNLKTLFGSAEIEYTHVHGSEWTGYMYTSQTFKVGDHDLYSELNDYHGKYCYLKIYSNIVKYREDIINQVIDQ